MQTVGFWKGLGMAWTSCIQMVVKMFQAGETVASGIQGVAESFEASTKVLKANVSVWESEAMKELENLKA